MVKLKVKRATTFGDSATGLLTAKKPYPLLLKTRFGIHTFGMRFPIDVLILSDKKIVVAVKKNLAPNRLFFWSLRFDIVIEFPQGFISAKGIKIGDRVQLVESD